ncbi:hypothetical protein BGZ94_008509 [Podila epigama]|nr:hypothetical protein BGZ94_008509 [Podila epigama]
MTPPGVIIDEWKRPSCFCGKLAISVYPSRKEQVPPSQEQQPSTTVYSPFENQPTARPNRLYDDRDDIYTSASASLPSRSMPAYRSQRLGQSSHFSGSESTLITTNFIYECHYTLLQEGMTLTDICERCDEAFSQPIEQELACGFEVSKRINGQKQDKERTKSTDDSWQGLAPLESNQQPTSHWYQNNGGYNQGHTIEGDDPWMDPVVEKKEPSRRTSTHLDFCNYPSLPSGYTLPSPPRRKVCGFHMHALEWQTIQTMPEPEALAVVRSAKCPVFNLSITRWLDGRPNDLDLQPFNDIACYCKSRNPMIIRLFKTSQGTEQYMLSCVDRAPLPLRPDFGKDKEPKDQIMLMAGGCSRKLALNGLTFSLRTTPVHATFETSPLIRYFSGSPEPGGWYGFITSRKKGSILKDATYQREKRLCQQQQQQLVGSGIPRNSKWRAPTVRFKQPPFLEEVVPPIKLSLEKTMLTLPKWYDPHLKHQILEDEKMPEWPPDKMHEWMTAMSKFGVKSVSTEVMESMRQAAFNDALDLAREYDECADRQYEDIKGETLRLEREFAELEEVQKKLAIEAKTMHENRADMLQRHKCRVCWDEVSSYLSKKEQAICCRVSRTWHGQFTPLLWRELRLISIDPLSTISSSVDGGTRHWDEVGPSQLPKMMAAMNVVPKHGCFVRELEFFHIHPYREEEKNREGVSQNGLASVLEHVSLSQLTKATLSLLPNDFQSSAGEALLRRNKHTLRVLSLSFHAVIDGETDQEDGDRGNQVVYRNVLTLPTSVHLHTLMLEQCRMSRSQLVDLLRACPGLLDLTFRKVQIVEDDSAVDSRGNDMEPFDHNYQHHGLQKFRMGGGLYLVLDHFPSLQTLEFYRFDRPSESHLLQRFCDSIRQHCPRLQEILAFGFECSMLPSVLGSMHHLVRFHGSNDIDTVCAMLNHAETLEKADLSEYTERAHLQLQVLEACPRLRSFKTHSSKSMKEVVLSILGSPVTNLADGNKDSSICRNRYGEFLGWACKNHLQELRLGITGLSPTSIQEIMTIVKARRVDEDRRRMRTAVTAMVQQAMSNSFLKHKSPIVMVGSMEIEMETFLASFVQSMPRLELLNLGTGWYRVQR